MFARRAIMIPWPAAFSIIDVRGLPVGYLDSVGLLPPFFVLRTFGTVAFTLAGIFLGAHYQAANRDRRCFNGSSYVSFILCCPA
jgi:hypothetical protein